MIIVRVFGGLGNQLFQYAFGQYMAQQLGRAVLYDFSYFKKDRLRAPAILAYNFKIDQAPFAQVKKYLPFKSFRLNSLYNKILNPKTYCQRVVDVDPKQPLLYFHNYWQNKDFVTAILPVLQEQFALKNSTTKIQPIAAEILNTTAVSIHIRRGDYLLKENQKIFTQLSSSYFIKAIALIEKKLAGPLTFFIFSDDLDWAKAHFSTLKSSHFIRGNTDYEDLFLMSLCKHHIIANSTFSWWAATLNKQQGKIVIGPKDWFNGDKVAMEKLVSKHWLSCDGN
jgi:hypothetical protein